LQSVNWAWGLSLIALTIAIHAMGVAVMAIVGGDHAADNQPPYGYN